MPENTILLSHGAGGKQTRDLIDQVFLKHFKNQIIENLDDSAIINTSTKSAFTTDSYVIDPLFFPGGNIGTVAISGTVNDLLVSGALPLFISTGFILEEGLGLDTLEKIVISMAREAKKANVHIVTGDTKVVEKGHCDKIFINTAGVGKITNVSEHLGGHPDIKPGDKLIVSGYLGDHAVTILAARNNIKFEKNVHSDAQPLNKLLPPLWEQFGKQIKFTRDITRGGLATILNELCEKANFGIELQESSIPIREEVNGVCEIFGYDPLYLANEGKVLLVVEESAVDKIIKTMKTLPGGKDASIIGSVTESGIQKVRLKSVIGGSRVVGVLSGPMLPRIC